MRLRRAACCSSVCVRGSADSFSSSVEHQQQDYDADAVVVCMGRFSAPFAGPAGSSRQRPAPACSTSAPFLTASDDDGGSSSNEEEAAPRRAPAAAAAAGASSSSRRRSKSAAPARLHLQLYSIASPKMRTPRQADDDDEALPWAAPVRMKPDWRQDTKGYFEAPGARCCSLAPSSTWRESPRAQPQLPPITFVFAEVDEAGQLGHARLRALNKSIRRCMLKLQQELPGRDGYVCRCQGAELKFIVAFDSPVHALQWCLLLQEALMYIAWPEELLKLRGFEQVLDSSTGLPLFRGPRLRIGLSESWDSSLTNISPDHAGCATYTGGAVNRAARFMDAAAHPGQVVCDADLVHRCFMLWAAHSTAPPASSIARESYGSAAGSSRGPATPPSGPASKAAASDLREPDCLLPAPRSMSETSGHCRPATGGLPGLHTRRQQQQQQQMMMMMTRASSGADGSRLAGRASSSSSRRQQLPLRSPSHSLGMLQEEEAAAAGRSVPSHPDAVAALTVLRLGVWAFKGSGSYDMVQIAHTALLGRSFPDEAPRGKGSRLAAASGVMAGLPHAQLRIPGWLLAAREAFKQQPHP